MTPNEALKVVDHILRYKSGEDGLVALAIPVLVTEIKQLREMVSNLRVKNTYLREELAKILEEDKT